MTFDARESSQNDGSPQRLFLFTVGDRRFTYVNSGRPALYLGETYMPMSVDIESDLEQALSEAEPTVQVRLDARSEFAQLFIPFMPSQPVKLRVYRHHVGDVSGEYKTEIIGEVANAAIQEGQDTCVLTVRLIASALDRRVPWHIYQKQCNHVLYGPGCRVNRDRFKTETRLTGVEGVLIMSPDFVKSDPRWFVAGYVVRKFNGDARWIIAQDGPQLTLQAPFVGLRDDEEVIAFAGCDLLKSTCEFKFDNLPRFFGFQWVPTKNPFRDNVFGTSPGNKPGGTRIPNFGRGVD